MSLSIVDFRVRKYGADFRYHWFGATVADLIEIAKTLPGAEVQQTRRVMTGLASGRNVLIAKGSGRYLIIRLDDDV